MSEPQLPIAPRLERRPASRTVTRFVARTMGILAALCVALFGNLLAVRFDQRWDFTPDRRYTPPSVLLDMLTVLKTDVTVTVLLSRTDPIAATLEQLLESYRISSHHFGVDWIDPDRDPMRFLARQSELGIASGRTEDGQVTSDAIVVLASRGRRHYIAAEEVIGLDPDAAESTGNFEHSLVVGLQRVLGQASPVVCFSQGFRELSTSDTSPVGLSRLKARLERNVIATRVLELAEPEASPPQQAGPADCQLIVVAAPDAPLSENALAQLTRAAAHSSLLLLGGVVPDADGKLTTVGLERLAELGGIILGDDVVVEMDDAFRLPNLFGETFLSTPLEHPTTRGLLRGNASSPLRVVVSLAQSLDKQPGSQALPILASSGTSVALKDVSQQSIAGLETKRSEGKSRTVAMAASLSNTDGNQRRIVVAPANIWQNRSFDTPSAMVTQAFGMSVISWLVASRSEQVELEPRPSRPASLELSEQEFRQIARYVSLVMPSCFLLIGMAVLWQRSRRKEAESRHRGDRGKGAA